MKYSVYFIVIFFVTPAALGQDWKVSEIEKSIIHFENGESIDTKLYNLRVIDLIYPNKNPFLILSGKGCDYCDANISIYIHSPSLGDMENESKQTRFSYPGNVYDPFTGDSLFYSDLYYGKCLSEETTNVIWIQKEFDGNNSIRSAFFIDFNEEEISYSSQEQDIESFEKLVRESLNDECFQINGVSRSAEM